MADRGGTGTLVSRQPGRIFVGGRWQASSSSDAIVVTNPATEEPVGMVADGTAVDVDRAVQAARGAQREWNELDLAERVAFVVRIGDLLLKRRRDIADCITSEVGTPIEQSLALQADHAINTFRRVPEAVEAIVWTEVIGNTQVLKEPFGVVGCISPWNYPLYQLATKVAPALVGGNTVVVKGSQLAPLSLLMLAEAVEEAGLPAGVFNLVSGRGSVVGEAIAKHPGVDMVSFTGSTEAGRQVARSAASSVKKLALELGGKSPAIVLDDAKLEVAISQTVAKCYQNTGQTCTALSRLLVPIELLPQAEQLAASEATRFKPGDPTLATTTLGPVISDEQRASIRRAITDAAQDGAKIIAGGPNPPTGISRGYFVHATVLSDREGRSSAATTEIFGPVLTILTFKDDHEAVRIANASDYALSAGVWSADAGRAAAMARRIRAGSVIVNGGKVNHQAPFGGFKQSGYGRERGRFGVEEFLTTKAIHA